MRTRLGFILAATLIGGVTTPLSARQPAAGPAPFVIRIVPRVGLVAPDSYLYEQYSNFSGDGPVEWTNGHLGRALVLGLGFEVGRMGAGVQVRGEILRSFRGWLSAAHSVVIPREVFDPPRVQTTWFDVPTAVTVMSLQLVVPTRLTLGRAQPYVLAGAAGKHYDFGDPTRANEVAAILPASGTTWGGEVGAGFTVPFLGLVLDLQGRDTINRYWGKTEHDLVFSTGLLWRIL